MTHHIQFLPLIAFIALSGIVSAQQTIPISDSLAAHAEILELTKGYISGKKIKKFHFGEYSMHSYTRMATKNRSNENYFGTVRSSESLYTSSFKFSNSFNDTALVLMSRQVNEKTRAPLVIGVVEIGGKNLLGSDFFTAWITINRDTSDIWTLFVGTSSGKEVEETQTAYLTNGDRTINFTLVRAREKGKNILGLPAMGYEFTEEGNSIGAIQFIGDKIFPTSFTVWMDNRLDIKTKFLLATTMTALSYTPDELSE